MILKFEKYHGAGNDFIIIDSNDIITDLNQKQVELLCNRRFGVGADGLMIISKSEQNDFAMKYFNSDGFEGSMCGNGGRCIAKYAYTHGFANKKMSFEAVDGIHNAEILEKTVCLSMKDVEIIEEFNDGFFLDTGSPHFVKFVDDLSKVNVYNEGKELADDIRFSPKRTNVNFVEYNANNSKIATFERGVEYETLACGTGTVAAALSIYQAKKSKSEKINLIAKGGELDVVFEKTNKAFINIKLIGPATFVYKGEIEIPRI